MSRRSKHEAHLRRLSALAVVGMRRDHIDRDTRPPRAAEASARLGQPACRFGRGSKTIRSARSSTRRSDSSSRVSCFEPELLYLSNERVAGSSTASVTGAPEIVIESAHPGTRKRDETIKRRPVRRWACSILGRRPGARHRARLSPLGRRSRVRTNFRRGGRRARHAASAGPQIPCRKCFSREAQPQSRQQFDLAVPQKAVASSFATGAFGS